jgi:hypothetical protein
MHSRRRKWIILAAAGSLAGAAMLLLFRSIPIAAGTATTVIVGIVILKHVALAIIVGSPLAGLFKSIQPNARTYCPLGKS